MFRAVLVANRGEIALRIIRTLRRLGIRAVLAAAPVDRTSPAARAAHEVVPLPGQSAAETYLNIDALIAAAAASSCDALHPGYGFLSESPRLARACAAAGIVFVGPSPAALELLGNKVAARSAAEELGIPVIPAWHDDTGNDATVAKAARGLGFPLMLKARSGGGGRGMRRLDSADDLPAIVAGARREAAASFGDGGLFLERLVLDAHHVEVQVIGDAHGTVLHLGERDCSVQRRHQKLIEETPSPAVDEALRAKLVSDAVRLCAAVAYVGAATVEFLVRPATTAEAGYHFLEVNPRLQVEHPVTEAVTGLDLVELQLRVAAGEPLHLAQHQVSFDGAAIELRLNAESPARDFEPAPGRIARLSFPVGVRVDAGYDAGDTVPPQFDSLVAKLIVHAPDRAAALARARYALANVDIDGVPLNTTFLDRVIAHPAFAAGKATTSWLDAELPSLLESSTAPGAALAAAAAAMARFSPSAGPFAGARWFGAGPAALWLWDGEFIHDVRVALDGSGTGTVEVGSETFNLDRNGPPGSVTVDGVEMRSSWSDGVAVVESATGQFRFAQAAPPPLPPGVRGGPAGGPRVVLAPLAGTVAGVHVAPGQQVAAGDLLVTLEAMKMEHRIVADSAAIVAAVDAVEAMVVARGDPLVELTPP